MTDTATIGEQFGNVFNTLVKPQSEEKVVETAPKRLMKPSIARTVHFKELNKKVKRIVTVHYDYNRVTKVLKYGGVIFKLTTDQKYDKNGHTKTATERCKSNPITITNFTDDKDIKWFHQCLRHQLFFYGVQSLKGVPEVFGLTKLPKVKKQEAKPVTEKPTKVQNPVGGDITKMKPVITRCINIKEAHGATNRIITIKYEYDRVNKVLKYGAVIHKADTSHPEPYDKAGHHKTAEERFKSSPVTINNFADDVKQIMFNKNLRKQLFTHGVKAK